MRRTGARFLALVVMLIQLTVSVVLPLSHAAAEAGALNHKVHIQPAGDEVCVPHADLTCATCRVLGHQLAPASERTQIAIFPANASSMGCTHDQATSTHRFFSPFGPRAPPVW